LATVPAQAAPCDGPREAVVARPAAIKAFVLSTGKSVLTFSGYSGAEYEDPATMRAAVGEVLRRHDPQRTLINIGATAVGIGAVYELAKAQGFTTMGIVSTLARDEQVPLSPCVDQVFYVPDTTWGGHMPGSNLLSPTSQAMVDSGTEFVAVGGGDVTRDEMLAARRAGKPVQFVPADMNHAIARRKAESKGLPAPTDFRGSAHAAWVRGGD
ncbi:MAG: hypothetical protein JNJ44_08180, partial [Zoogloeaceae bacterium]|nr:hypothetical protein [Zoogloeaceae bacterium]